MFNNVWDGKEYNKLLKKLDEAKENKDYIDFTSKIVNTNYKIIGIKTPNLKKIAKEIGKTDIISYLNICKDNTYEEVILQGLAISYIKDVKTSIKCFNKFIKKIDSWAICDTVIASMKIVKKNKEIYYKEIEKYIKSKDEFIVRVGIILLLDYYIDDIYIDNIFELINNINREEYYINMGIAWLVSVCFVKQKDKTYKYLKNNNLDKFTYNKAIQKMIESFRVEDSDKDILRQMKRV